MRRLTLLTLLALGAIVRPAMAVLIGVPSYPNGGADTVLHHAPTGLERYARAGQFLVTTNDPATGETRTVHAYSNAIARERPADTTVTLGLLSDTVRDAAKLLQVNALLTNGDAWCTTMPPRPGCSWRCGRWRMRSGRPGTT